MGGLLVGRFFVNWLPMHDRLLHFRLALAFRSRWLFCLWLADENLLDHIPFFVADTAHMICHRVPVARQQVEHDLAFRMELLCQFINSIF